MSPVTRPARAEVRVFPDAAAFRAWLDEHHATEDVLWVGFYRSGVPKPAMRYPEAVDEALCYGWIDGITYRIDDELRAQRFTPRRPTSGWSAVNLAKMAALDAAGRLHPAGRRVFEARDRRKDQPDTRTQPPASLPPAWRERLEGDPSVAAAWEAQPPGYRRTAVEWVMAAKRPETRERRFATLLEETRRGNRPRPFRVTDD